MPITRFLRQLFDDGRVTVAEEVEPQSDDVAGELAEALADFDSL